ncbi:hypothetical protein [Candidatus Poriferisocius sp.]|uniref:hypothetical protein n=1 Tax=Candidatus Poriferisocius sp. TaxID=3101276 RepID=UPI003B01FF11
MFDESQWVRVGKATEKLHRHVIGQPDCDLGRIHAATEAWGGPLPGLPDAIQEGPLRLEMRGRPPQHLLDAANIHIEDERLAGYWQLRPEARQAAIYHNRHYLIPLPALPAGLVLFGENCEAGIRELYTWDQPRLLSRRIYVSEMRPGSVRECWPHLVPSIIPERCSDYWAYGIEYDGNMTVTAVHLYLYYYDVMTPEDRKNVERRQAEWDRLADRTQGVLRERVTDTPAHGPETPERVGHRLPRHQLAAERPYDLA